MYTSLGTSSGFSAKYSLPYAASTLYLRQYGSEAVRQDMETVSTYGLYGISAIAPYLSTPRRCPNAPSWDLARAQPTAAWAPPPLPPAPTTRLCHHPDVHVLSLVASIFWARPYTACMNPLPLRPRVTYRHRPRPYVDPTCTVHIIRRLACNMPTTLLHLHKPIAPQHCVRELLRCKLLTRSTAHALTRRITCARLVTLMHPPVARQGRVRELLRGELPCRQRYGRRRVVVRAVQVPKVTLDAGRDLYGRQGRGRRRCGQ